MTPRPPACAIAMARRDSVTVSMAAEMIGIESPMSRVIWVLVETSPGRTAELPGFIRTSSKVRYSGIWRLAIGQPLGKALVQCETTQSGLARAHNIGPKLSASGKAAGATCLFSGRIPDLSDATTE